MATKYVQTNTLYLAGAGVIVGATTVVLTTLTDIYGNVLTMADFGSKGFITLEPDTTNEEAATFTGVMANANGTYTLTGVSTILAKSPYTESNGLVRNHAGGTKTVVTDNVAFWNTFANKNNDETILGTWTFNIAPVALSATPASTTVLGNVKTTVTPSKSLGTATITIASPAVITNNSHGLIAGDSLQFTTTGALPTGITAATTYYVIAAGLTANTFEISLTVGGTAINTSGSQSGVHTLFRTTPFAVVDNDSRLLQNAYGVDSVGTDSYAITLATAPTAYAAGQVFSFQAGTANTSAATLNVNGLGAKTIKKEVSVDLVTGDILANQIVLVMYDGTNFQMLSMPSPDKSVFNGWVGSAGSASKNLADSTAATQTIAHGLGVIPKKVRIQYLNVSTSNKAVASGDGSFVGSTYAALASIVIQGTSLNSVADTSTSYAINVYDASTSTSGGAAQSATVAVDATNITLTWTKTGSPTGTVTFLWAAEGFTTASVDS